ncbi:MAG TPA: dihydrolipoyl dehydrogenase [Candidatus Cloacimonadota bacterium]|nr:dihydrolipoyl dehydrogenase [Candidatus Cloacimonadota bacterium]HPT72955.1 dihydrolipoyl dehydrogenase [Candidatus Cloacimonadota bacterium]
MNHYQVAIIGGGPGGYVTAIRLNQYGISTIVFEKDRLGGVCLNWGCIPTKALVKVADLYGEIRNSEEFGIHVNDFSIDYEKVFNRKNEVVEKLVSGVEFIFRKRKMEVMKETVTEIKKDQDQFVIHSMEGTEVSAEYVIIATGSVPKPLPFMPFDGNKILSSTDILNLRELPKSLAIIGGGVIGCEFASIFMQMGVKVEIVEFLPSILTTEDEEIAKRMSMAFKKAGVKINTGAGVERYEEQPDGIHLFTSNGKEIIAEKVLVSVGRDLPFKIEMKGLNLDMDRGRILINDKMETNLPNIFAIGDITGKLQLAHTASKQGLIAAEILKQRIAGQPETVEPLEYMNIPRCTFTNPEIASVGFSEKEAVQKYASIKVGKFPFGANGKAIGLGATFGFVKTIVDADSGLLVGMHIIGPQATELIAQGAILIGSRISNHEAAEIVCAHPTLSEAVAESIEDSLSLAIHQV